MTLQTLIPFRKMNGLGNDFVVIDMRPLSISIGSSEVQRIADHAHGVGCDQVILLEPSSRADIFMRIFNADGSEVETCGNALRCVAQLMGAEMSRARITIETRFAIMAAEMNEDYSVTVDMGAPLLKWDEIPLSEEFYDTRMIELQVGPIDNPVLHSPSVINVGNPHCIFWVDDVRTHDLERVGPFLEHHIMFPECANISLAQVTSPEEIILRVWERGVGLTKACGTAACAAAVSAVRKELTGREVRVILPGGPLHIRWREADHHIFMTGPACLDYEGQIEPSTFRVEGV